jgi:simple sugar transport system permease protein
VSNIVQFLSSFLAADLRVATPILMAAMGLIYMEKSGVVNIGAEGTMLIGAFVGSFGAWLSGSPWIGLLLAGLAGMVTGLLFALIVVTVKANQIVAGIAFNTFALGLTTIANRMVFGLNTDPAKISGFSVWKIPLLSRIPLLGEALFAHMGPVYCILLFVPLTWYIMQKTSIGLKIRAVGEHPKAADTAGINVFLVRYATIVFGSFFVGASGAYLSLGILHIFTENMVTGRGYIALAAVIFGKWNPWGILGAALLFGFGDALQIRVQAMGSSIPYQFMLMLPYLLTVAALAGLVGKSTPPMASGKPYSKDE